MIRIMGILEAFLISMVLFLLFPKGFKYFIGAWLGAMTGAMLWGLIVGGMIMVGQNPTWDVMGWSFLMSVFTCTIVGCALASQG